MNLADYHRELNIAKSEYKKRLENIDKKIWNNKFEKFLFYNETKAKREMRISLIDYEAGFSQGFNSALKLSNKQFKENLEKDL